MKTTSEALNTARSGDPAIWIYLPETVSEGVPGPLSGMPFAVKDNIDVAGMPTTAACPDYRYLPAENATVVQRLIDAGAVPMGKTNLDQFATGLVGTRSPYGIPANVFDPAYIPGGSSSGSAVAVASGQVPFALGTDTAGSGRVPAAFNELVGLKPTRGLLSNHGLVPACRSLDCISVFARTVPMARKVFQVAAGFDPKDPWSRKGESQARRREQVLFAVPREEDLNFFGNREYARCFAEAVEGLERLGWEKRVLDFRPFLECARLLYEGPWVAERTAAIESLLKSNPEALLPVTRQIIEGGFKGSAVETFKALYRLKEYQRIIAPIWEEIDTLVTPTAGTHYRIDEVAADPVSTNSNLGTYTNYMNLLDLSAIAVPAGRTASGMPFGITLCAPAFHDLKLMDLAQEWMTGEIPPPDRQGWVRFAVCGAHLKGFPLNSQITDRGGRFVTEVRSAPCYRFVALNTQPPKPGMIYRPEGGVSVQMELWEMPLETFGSFVTLISAPLAMGTVFLEDGSTVLGFTCDASAAAGSKDISE
ncbi:MAG: allophanate hydrolase, partial [Kiritimatiellia bacterium]